MASRTRPLMKPFERRVTGFPAATGISDGGLAVGTYVDSRAVQHGFED
jgi:hypothetical protein